MTSFGEPIKDSGGDLNIKGSGLRFQLEVGISSLELPSQLTGLGKRTTARRIGYRTTARMCRIQNSLSKRLRAQSESVWRMAAPLTICVLDWYGQFVLGLDFFLIYCSVIIIIIIILIYSVFLSSLTRSVALSLSLSLCLSPSLTCSHFLNVWKALPFFTHWAFFGYRTVCL